MLQLAKPFLIKGLCEDICQLLFSVDVNDVNVFLQHMIPEKVMTNLNVLLSSSAELGCEQS